MGRKQKPFQTSWGEIIPGLYKSVDGRWKILATKKWYTEHDERLAVQRFKRECPPQSLFVPIARSVDAGDLAEITDGLGVDGRAISIIDHKVGENGGEPDMEVGYNLDAQATWSWLRQLLINDAAYVAKQVGIPQLASLASFDIPKDAIRISAVETAYRLHSTATDKGKNEALKCFNRLVDFCQAKTLADFNDKSLSDFRQSLLNDPNLTSSGTISAMLARIKSVINRASRGELDPIQLSELSARLKSKLYAPENNVEDDPHPISREDFHTLLNGVNKTGTPHVWKAMLLLGLNAALYMEDICDLKWDNIDLENKTLIARRKKKGKCLRVAVLWDETIEALKALARRGTSPYVFTSPHGTRYNKNTKINDFKDYRSKLGLDDIRWSHLRDGAYTAAVNAVGVDEKFARKLAGHKSGGLQDKYCLRHPQCVKVATDAVYAAYFG